MNLLKFYHWKQIVNILGILKCCGDLTETNLKMSLNLYKIYYSGSISSSSANTIISISIHTHIYEDRLFWNKGGKINHSQRDNILKLLMGKLFNYYTSNSSSVKQGYFICLKALSWILVHVKN